MKRALFLDRDGPVIVDRGYTRDPALVALTEGAADGLREARALGFALVLVSNQSGIGRGMIAPDEARAVHARMEELLAAEGIALDAAYYCPHAPDAGCDCRKPAPGMLLRAAREHELDLPRSVMVGDKGSDVDAGLAAGCRAIRFAAPLASPSERAASAVDWREVLALLRGW